MDISAIVANGLEKTSGSPLTRVGQNIDLMWSEMCAVHMNLHYHNFFCMYLFLFYSFTEYRVHDKYYACVKRFLGLKRTRNLRVYKLLFVLIYFLMGIPRERNSIGRESDSTSSNAKLS